MNQIKIFMKLMRFRPVIAWTICGFMLAIAVAYYETGELLNHFPLFVAFVTAVLIQGVFAHAVNDLVDEEADKFSNIEQTGRVKVLLNGLATRRDLKDMIIFAITLTFVSMLYIIDVVGYVILLFGAVGVFAAALYSLSPFKLGWRPFSELTIVFPAIVTMVIAFNYIASLTISPLIFYVAFIHAMLNIKWFMDSRMVDIVIDDTFDKVTTAVMLRRRGFTFTRIYDYYMMTLFLILVAVSVISFGMFGYELSHFGKYVMFIPLILFVCSYVFDVIRIVMELCRLTVIDFEFGNLVKVDTHSFIHTKEYSVMFAKCRVRGIYITISNACLLSVCLLI